MRYELTFSETLPEADMALMHAYWALAEGKFVHKTDALATAHDLTVPGLTSLARAYTRCRVSLGYCLSCGDEVLVELTSRSAFTAHLRNFEPPRCPECQQAYLKRQQFEAHLTANKAVSALGPNAVELKAWDYLTPLELSVLKGIVQN